jgi:hypothetical protein
MRASEVLIRMVSAILLASDTSRSTRSMAAHIARRSRLAVMVTRGKQLRLITKTDRQRCQKKNVMKGRQSVTWTAVRMTSQ